MLLLYDSLRALAEVLNDYSEFKAAYDLLDGIMPAVIECEDATLCAECLSSMVDSQVGMAGKDKERRVEYLNTALELIDRCFAGMYNPTSHNFAGFFYFLLIYFYTQVKIFFVR